MNKKQWEGRGRNGSVFALVLLLPNLYVSIFTSFGSYKVRIHIIQLSHESRYGQEGHDAMMTALFVCFTLKIHFFSFCKHLTAPDTSCTSRMIMFFSCLFRKRKK